MSNDKLPFQDLIDAFLIFRKYTDNDYISAEHDVIYACALDVYEQDLEDIVSQEDLNKLKELGWHWNSTLTCFYSFT